ncbi:hypothetical protein [Streptomyces sp. NBC_01210]|uniref:hypothetical protein n=1 Tax=Streptomyces sp. NBC_01210 TaxID=2903774 RepID=UPI003FA3A776
MAQTQDGPRTSFLSEVKDAVSTRAAVLVIGVPALQLAFITPYIGAFHQPKPHEISTRGAPPTGCWSWCSPRGRWAGRWSRWRARCSGVTGRRGRSGPT